MLAVGRISLLLDGLRKCARLVGCVLLVLGPIGCQKAGEVRTHIKGFDGALNPVDGLVHVDIYILVGATSDRMDAPSEQNLIEVVTPKETMRFRWPDQFGAGWAEVIDLDADGFRGGLRRKRPPRTGFLCSADAGSQSASRNAGLLILA